MLKATNDTITPNAKLPAGIELTPERVEYVGANEVLVSMKTSTGDLVTFTLKTVAMMTMVNMSVNLINSYTAQVFRDLDVL